MSDTPLTDAKIEEHEHMPHGFLAAGLAITARELERELAAAKARNKELEQDRDMWRDRVLDVEDTLKDERAAHLEAQRALVMANRKIRLFANARHYIQWQEKFGPLVEAAIDAVAKEGGVL